MKFWSPSVCQLNFLQPNALIPLQWVGFKVSQRANFSSLCLLSSHFVCSAKQVTFSYGNSLVLNLPLMGQITKPHTDILFVVIHTIIRYKQSMNHIFLWKVYTELQYQASSATLEWPGDGGCYLMQFRACSHVSDATLSMKGRIFQHPITAATVLWHDVQPIRWQLTRWQASYLGSLHQTTHKSSIYQLITRAHNKKG